MTRRSDLRRQLEDESRARGGAGLPRALPGAHRAGAGPEPLVLPAGRLHRRGGASACAERDGHPRRRAERALGAQGRVHRRDLDPDGASRRAPGSMLVGHSERRHLFGETDEQVARKTAAVLKAGLHPAGLRRRDPRRAGRRPHRAGDPAPARAAARQGRRRPTGRRWCWPTSRCGPSAPARNATPDDAAQVHELIRFTVGRRGVPGRVPILYGGSVNAGQRAQPAGAARARRRAGRRSEPGRRRLGGAGGTRWRRLG